MTLEIDGEHLNEIVQMPDGSVVYQKQLVWDPLSLRVSMTSFFEEVERKE